ncbi:MAG: hypothetical protein M0P12_05705 [Paludibacteraceae bacterium]|nr:hypothetical protein [Paludibacteraceae bacterium]HOI27002.1 hypothetical protein [Paludibacteraceae bacterium]HPH62853.1 hypothetical protein [Paludibacteraceae bacterium]
MRKPTLLVPILFVYSFGMAIWGYTKENITLNEMFVFMGVMTLVLVVLWFLYRKKEKYAKERDERLGKENQMKFQQKKLAEEEKLHEENSENIEPEQK